MNYHHDYHAGNAADVFKHLVLLSVLHHFCQKPAPFAYLETHAAQGISPLTAEKALKTQEFKQGVARVVAAKATLSPYPLLNTYLEGLHQMGYPEYYPGSPSWAQAYTRSQDSLVFVEKQPLVASALKQRCRADKRCHVHQRDAYEALKALLPLQHPRGLVLIDPPYEMASEWQALREALVHCQKVARQTCIALWYPIKADRQSERGLKQVMQALPFPAEQLNIRLSTLAADTPQGLVGSGMWILNPPYQLKQSIEAWLPALWRALSETGQGGYHLSEREDTHFRPLA